MRLPPALKVIEKDTFRECKNLKTLEFPEDLEKIDLQAFALSGLENVELPASLRTISQAAFYKCESLNTIKFNEGLEVLGTDEYDGNGEKYLGIFEDSSIKSIELPSTLRRIEYSVFRD